MGAKEVTANTRERGNSVKVSPATGRLLVEPYPSQGMKMFQMKEFLEDNEYHCCQVIRLSQVSAPMGRRR